MSILIFIIVIVGSYVGLEYNKIQNLLQKVRSRKSNIQSILEQKIDLINKAIEIVQDYSEHEKLIFINSNQNFNQAYKSSEKTLVILKSLVMAYPELKSNIVYLNLLDNISKIEYGILERKEKYNQAVENYNTARLCFPINLFAKRFGFLEIEYFNSESHSVTNL